MSHVGPGPPVPSASLRCTAHLPGVTLAETRIAGRGLPTKDPEAPVVSSPTQRLPRVSTPASWPWGSRVFLKHSRSPILTLMWGPEGVRWVIAETLTYLPAADPTDCLPTLCLWLCSTQTPRPRPAEQPTHPTL